MSDRRPVVDSQCLLFDRYDIVVEFEERLKRIDAHLAACSAAEEDAAVVKRLEDGFALCPLELCPDRATLEIIPAGHMQGTGEPVCEYIYRIPFQGDPELWSLRPSCSPRFEDSLTEGEVYRGNVIVAFFVTSAEEAEGLFRTASSQIQLVLKAQTSDIETFNEMLAALIWRKLTHYRIGFCVRETAATRH